MTFDRRLVLVPLLGLLTACQELLPTAESEELVRAGVAIEVTLTARDFLNRTRVYGGYGRTSELGGGFIAHRFGAVDGPPTGPGANPDAGLEAATLLRFGRYPASFTVTDTAGTSRPDSSLTFLSARIVAPLRHPGQRPFRARRDQGPCPHRTLGRDQRELGLRGRHGPAPGALVAVRRRRPRKRSARPSGIPTRATRS